MGHLITILWAPFGPIWSLEGCVPGASRKNLRFRVVSCRSTFLPERLNDILASEVDRHSCKQGRSTFLQARSYLMNTHLPTQAVCIDPSRTATAVALDPTPRCGQPSTPIRQPLDAKPRPLYANPSTPTPRPLYATPIRNPYTSILDPIRSGA